MTLNVPVSANTSKMTNQIKWRSFHPNENGNESVKILKQNQQLVSHPIKPHLIIAKSNSDRTHQECCNLENEEINSKNDFTLFTDSKKSSEEMMPLGDNKRTIMNLNEFPTNQIKVEDLSMGVNEISRKQELDKKRKPTDSKSNNVLIYNSTHVSPPPKSHVVVSKLNADTVNCTKNNTKKRGKDLAITYMSIENIPHRGDKDSITSNWCYAPTHQIGNEGLSVDRKFNKEKNVEHKKRRLQHHRSFGNFYMFKSAEINNEKKEKKLDHNVEYKCISTNFHHRAMDASTDNNDNNLVSGVSKVANNEAVSPKFTAELIKINTNSVSKNESFHRLHETNHKIHNKNKIFFDDIDKQRMQKMQSIAIANNSCTDNGKWRKNDHMVNMLVVENALNLQDPNYHLLQQIIQMNTNTNETIDKLDLTKKLKFHEQFEGQTCLFARVKENKITFLFSAQYSNLFIEFWRDLWQTHQSHNQIIGHLQQLGSFEKVDSEIRLIFKLEKIAAKVLLGSEECQYSQLFSCKVWDTLERKKSGRCYKIYFTPDFLEKFYKANVTNKCGQEIYESCNNLVIAREKNVMSKFLESDIILRSKRNLSCYLDIQNSSKRRKLRKLQIGSTFSEIVLHNLDLSKILINVNSNGDFNKRANAVRKAINNFKWTNNNEEKERASPNYRSYLPRTNSDILCHPLIIKDVLLDVNETLKSRQIDNYDCTNERMPTINKDIKIQIHDKKTEKGSIDDKSYRTASELKQFLIDQDALLEMRRLVGYQKYSQFFCATIGQALIKMKWIRRKGRAYVEPKTKKKYVNKKALIEYILTSEKWKNRPEIHMSCNQFIEDTYEGQKAVTNVNSNDNIQNKADEITRCQVKQPIEMKKSHQFSTYAALKQFYTSTEKKGCLRNAFLIKRKKLNNLFLTLIWKPLKKLKWTKTELPRSDRGTKTVYHDPKTKKNLNCMKALMQWILTSDHWKCKEKIQEICHNFFCALLQDDNFNYSLLYQCSIQQNKKSRKNQAGKGNIMISKKSYHAKVEGMKNQGGKGNRLISKKSYHAKVEGMRQFNYKNYIVRLEVRPSQKFKNRNGLFVSFESPNKVLLVPSQGIDIGKFGPFTAQDERSVVVLEAKQFLFQDKIYDIPVWERNGIAIDVTDQNCIVHEEADDTLLLEMNKTDVLTLSNVDAKFNYQNELHYILREKFRIHRGESRELLVYSMKKKQDSYTVSSFYNFIKKIQGMDEKDILDLITYFSNHAPENSEARFRMHWATKQINTFCSKILYGNRRKKTPEFLQLRINEVLNSFPRTNNIEDEVVVTKNEYVGSCVKILCAHGYKIGMIEEVITNKNKRKHKQLEKYKINFNDKEIGFQEWDEEEVEKQIFPVPFGNWMLM